MSTARTAKYGIGQIVRHRVFPFRGVVFDVDPVFDNTEEWWLAIPEEVRPSKDQPYYHLLAENAESEYIAGKEYTIADIAIWPWYGGLAKGVIYGDSATFLDTASYKNVQRWTAQIAARPAVKRGRIVNRVSGDPAQQLHERHDAGDFETKTQDKLEAAK